MKSKKKSKKGGEALGAGTFGCVFRPNLKCKDLKIKFKDGVSKLLFTKDANEEMEIIKKIMPIIEKIPDNENYFIPNSEQLYINCRVGELSDKDLKNTEKCSNFEMQLKSKYPHEYKNFKVSQDWIEKNKDLLSIIQQEDGGEDFNKVIKSLNGKDFMKKFSLINNKMINLIENGIRPMNENGL